MLAVSESPQTVDLKGEYVEHAHLLTSDEAGWDGLSLIYEREPAGEAPETSLEQHLLIICLGDFQANYQLNGNWQHEDYTEGDVILFPTSEPFPRVQVDREVELVELFLEPATLARAAFDMVRAEHTELMPQLKLRDPLIQQMGLALKTELEAGGKDSRLYAESMAAALSVHLLRRYSSRNQKIRDYAGGLSRYSLREAIAYIREHLDQNLTLAELAGVVHMSPHHFASLFKQSTGLTPHQYVTRCRIEQAKHLLRQPKLPIVEVSQQVGFQNQSHFTRVFRQHTRTTPRAYRNSL